MNKYKVEFIQTETIVNTFVIDVLAESEQEATDKAQEKLANISGQGLEHYYQNGDVETTNETVVGTVYNVTNTDDPFDADIKTEDIPY